MAVITLTNDVVDNLRLVEMFDPDAVLDEATSTRVSLVSRDGYELLLQGTGFDFNRFDEPTAGTITDVFLYDPSGDLVARFDDISYSLEEYYDRVPVDGRPSGFVADLLSGADSLAGAGADDHLEGYAGNDSIRGGSGDDLLEGYSGNDTLRGDAGNDEIDGGTGNDVAFGGDGNDLIFGFDGNDRVFGDAGDDELYGEAGADSLVGGAGRDELYGGAGDDTLDGGADNDTLEGAAGRDRILAGDGDDRAGGGDDNDRIEAGNGNDTLFGDSGNDVMYGQAGADRLDGGSGNDVLLGGAGFDTIAGGSGSDLFRFNGDADRGDRILDFQRGQDTLAFASAGFANLTDDFGLVVGGAPEATSGVGTFLFDTDNHRLFYDFDGSGAGGARFIATLDDVTTLSRSDFDIV